MKNLLKITAQIALLWVIFQGGNLIVALLHLPLPGNVLGMLILFGLLSAKIIPLPWVEEGAALLLKHLAFFFIPIAVGLMNWGSLFSVSGLILVLALLTSALLSISLTGWLVQTIQRGKQEGET